MKVSLLGVPGNMGSEVVKAIVNEEYISMISLLIHDKKGANKIIKLLKKSGKDYRVQYGTVANIMDVKKTIEDCDYVINMAAVIPPLSDKKPQSAIEANEFGPEIIINAIEEIKENQPKLIHISTIGLYGDRNYKHPFAEVGDPLIISPFDLYALTKMRGEFKVLESDINEWVVIRQTALLYDSLLMKNVSDGLMFHTPFNVPLEWATSRDTAILMRNILRRDNKHELDDRNFWKHCFNIGGGEANRVTGYDTFKLGFEMIGCGVEDFFDTDYNALRNFHGSWYSDAYKLNDLFDFQHEDIVGFWKRVLNTHKYFKLACILPKKLLKSLVIKPLLKDDNAPYYWYKNKDEAKILAYFKGSEEFKKIPQDWKDFPLLVKGKNCDGGDIDYAALVKTPTRLEHFFDIDKDRSLISIEDLRKVAEARGGKLLEDKFVTGDIYRKVHWVNADGVEFMARPHTVLYCGHWINISYKEYAWDFDHLAKTDKMIAQIWYDAHDKDENHYYWYDHHFAAHYKDID